VSGKHLTAARNCGRFSGITRELLKLLCDHASDGGPNAKLPFGVTSIGITRMMLGCNRKRRQTITDALAILIAEGAVAPKPQPKERLYHFVSLKWLETNSFTDEDIEDFKRKLRKNPQITDPELGDNVELLGEPQDDNHNKTLV
jgi:hypothetical protein